MQVNKSQLDTKLLLSIDNASSKIHSKQKNFANKQANRRSD